MSPLTACDVSATATAAEIGDWVMAIGNPFGLGGSVTLGIVSARNRNIYSGPYDDFIQTDAAINQGNSGGPLFDMDGYVVGVNTAIISRTGGALGIGFAVPANLAAPVIDQLIANGEVRRGWLGVGIQEVSEDIALNLGLPSAEGAMVVEVTEGGPSRGVLRIGDIIRVFDGNPIGTMHDLPRLVSLTKVGKTVELTVLRDGVDVSLEVTLGQLDEGRFAVSEAPPAELPPATAEDSVDPPSLSDLVGFEAETLTSQLRDDFGVDGNSAGVIISAVRPGSDAEDKGIAPGSAHRRSQSAQGRYHRGRDPDRRSGARGGTAFGSVQADRCRRARSVCRRAPRLAVVSFRLRLHTSRSVLMII